MVRRGHKVFSGYDITLAKFPEYLIGSHQYQLSIDYTIDSLGKVHFLNARAIKVSQMQIYLNHIHKKEKDNDLE